VNDFLFTLGEEILIQVKDTVENPAFQDAITTIGDNVGHLADEAKEFVESDVGQFMLDFASNTVIFALDALGSVIGFVADELGRLNLALEKLEEGDVFGFLNNLPEFLKPGTGARMIQDSGIDGFRFRDVPITDMAPGFAKGGIVKARPGGLIGRIGEAGRDEAVIPLDRYGNLTTGGGETNITVNVNAGVGTDPVSVGREVVNAIKRYENTNGKVFASV